MIKVVEIIIHTVKNIFMVNEEEIKNKTQSIGRKKYELFIILLSFSLMIIIIYNNNRKMKMRWVYVVHKVVVTESISIFSFIFRYYFIVIHWKFHQIFPIFSIYFLNFCLTQFEVFSSCFRFPPLSSKPSVGKY